MKKWDLSTGVQQDETLASLVEQSKPVLEDAIGPPAAQVDARWTVVENPSGRRRLVLNLSDWTWVSGVETQFDPDELQSRVDVRRRFHRLWGDLLQARNHKQLEQLIEGQVGQ